jgi:hypothetical protein
MMTRASGFPSEVLGQKKEHSIFVLFLLIQELLKSVRCSGSCLQIQLLKRQKLGGLWFKASPGKNLERSHLN